MTARKKPEQGQTSQFATKSDASSNALWGKDAPKEGRPSNPAPGQNPVGEGSPTGGKDAGIAAIVDHGKDENEAWGPEASSPDPIAHKGSRARNIGQEEGQGLQEN